MIPANARPNGLARRLQSAADGLDTAGDPSNSSWMEGFADDAYLMEERIDELQAECARLREALHWALGELDGLGDEAPSHLCEFVHDPLKGACTFHEQWGEALSALQETANEASRGEPDE